MPNKLHLNHGLEQVTFWWDDDVCTRITHHRGDFYGAISCCMPSENVSNGFCPDQGLSPQSTVLKLSMLTITSSRQLLSPVCYWYLHVKSHADRSSKM